ncbi:unnamed protein product, partial [marine sediment metagenome]
TGQVVGWYTSPHSSDSCQISEHIFDDVLRQNGVDVDSFPRKIYFFPRIFSGNCGSAGGWASTGGNPSTAYIHGSFFVDLVSHELGHNLTLGHANSIECGNKAIDNYSNCTINYYGDRYGAMGNNWYGLFHHAAFFKSWLGWILLSSIQEVTQDGLYTIYPLESATNSIQEIRIRKPDTLEYYSIEYRQPVGFDNNLPIKITEGALIRIGYLTDYENSLKTYKSPEVYLIDNNPIIHLDYTDTALSDGQTFYDEVNNISITQISHDNNSVTLSIELDENACNPDYPSVTVNPTSQIGLPGQTLNYTVSVTNNDDSNCSITRFMLSKDTNYYSQGWIYSFSDEFLNINPGETKTTIYSVTSPIDSN